MVFRAAVVEFAYVDRLHHRRGPAEPDHARVPRERVASTGRRRSASENRCCSRHCWVLPCRTSFAAAQSTRRVPALYTEPKNNAAAVLDSGLAHPHLHRRVLRARIERRTKGHGPYHADPDRHGTDAYALNKAVNPAETQTFIAVAHEASAIFARYTNGAPRSPDPRADTEAYVRARELSPATLPAVQQLTEIIAGQVSASGSLAAVPLDIVDNVRNNMYLVSEAIRLMERAKQPVFAAGDLP